MRTRPFLASLTLATLVGCGGGGDLTGPSAVSTIEVSNPSGSLTSLGGTITLTAVGKSDNGRTVGGVTFTWSSANPGVATVNNGVVTAVGNGTTAISANAGSATGTTQVTVQQVAALVVVTMSADTIRAYGDTARASATARDAGGSPMGAITAAWTSSNPAVVAVDGNGLMTAVSEGTSTIRANSASLQGERSVVVRQRAATLVLTRQPAGARAGLAMETQPRAEVQDARGNRVVSDNNTVVTATLIGGDGSVISGGTVTANAGVVDFTALAIGGPAGAKALLFSAPSMSSASSANFALTAGLPTALVVVAGDGQTGLAGSPLPQPLQVGVRDAYGNAASAVPVSFSVQQGGGSVGADVVASDASGTAATTYTTSRHAGTAMVRAFSSAAPSAQALFIATATPNGIIRGTISTAPAAASPIGVLAASTTASRARGNRRQLRAVPSVLPPLTWPMGKQRAAVTSSASTPLPSTAPSDAEFVPGELLVTYRADRISAPPVGASAFQQASVVTAVSASIREAIAPAVDDGLVSVASVSPVLLTARVKLQPGVAETTAMARLRADPQVLSVERNGYLHTMVVPRTAMQELMEHSGLLGSVAAVPLEVLPTPLSLARGTSTYPIFGVFPGNTEYNRQAWHYNVVSLPQAWALSQGSPNVLVAVVDDGIRFEHPAMTGVMTNDGFDFVSVATVPLCAGGLLDVNGDGDGYDANPTQPSHHDRNGSCYGPAKTSGNHGLHVSGTIGAVRTSAAGLTGVSWNTRIRMVRALGTNGSGSFYDIAQGVLYAAGLAADNGAGGTVVAPGGPARVINMSLGGTGFSSTLGTAVAQAFANGTLIIASAGNANSSTPNYPASFPDVISVSAVAPTLSRASYSSFGSTVKIAAPGGETGAGTTHGVLSSTWNFVAGAPTIDSWQGTSMAAPHVTGIAALILAREPQLTPAQLSARLTNFAVDIGAAGPDQLFGAGLVNARNSLTASFNAPRQLFVRVVDASNGAIVRTVPAAPNGSYEVGGLADGQYWVYAGTDENGDGLIGLPLRPWGALGSAATPGVVIVDGAGIYPGSFAITTGFEVEPNNTPQTADELVVDGYMNASISGTSDLDMYRLRISVAGTYLLLATGQIGACGFAVETDPIITLFSSTGSQLAENDDIDFANNDLCANLQVQLAPGDYFVRVGGFTTGRYSLLARRV